MPNLTEWVMPLQNDVLVKLLSSHDLLRLKLLPTDAPPLVNAVDTPMVGIELSPFWPRRELLNSKRVSFTVFGLMIIDSVRRISCSRLVLAEALDSSDVSPMP